MAATMRHSLRAGMLGVAQAAAAVLATLAVLVETASPSSAASPGCGPAPKPAFTVSVRDKGARGDGRSDDTAAFQAAIDAAGGRGGQVWVPAGTYMVDAASRTPLKLRSNMSLKLDAAAVVKVIPNASEVYTLLWLTGVENVRVEGGTLEGDRREHQAKGGEWGMGLRIEGRSRNVTLANLSIRKMWGDGIYVAGVEGLSLCQVTADHNRRQGMSIIAGHGILMRNSVFKHTVGTAPAAGIDFEPNEATDTIGNVVIERSKFIDNAGPGILVAGKRAEISGLEIRDNLFDGAIPIKIENAGGVSSRAICKNRQITRPVDSAPGLGPAADPIPVVVVQSECGDNRIVVRRGKKG